jgi:universal stress protein E
MEKRSPPGRQVALRRRGSALGGNSKKELVMLQRLDTVLIGTPLCEASDEMIALGAELARRAGAHLHLVHAFEAPRLLPGPYFPPPPAAIDLDELDRASAEAMERQIVRLRLAERGPVSPHIRRGAAHCVLSELALELGAELTVIGASQDRAARILGSTAFRVVHQSECPVLVLRTALPLPPHRTLIPVDLSPFAAEVVRRGLDLLDLLGARPAAGETASGVATTATTGIAAITAKVASTAIEALHVAVPFDLEVFAPRFLPAEAKRAAAADLATFLLANHLGGGWNLAQRSAFGSAPEEILRRSDECAPDLVILGSHGHGACQRFLLGGVAEEVLRRCTSNVLVIPPRAAHAARELPARRMDEEDPRRGTAASR